MFTENPTKYVSLFNLADVAKLERRLEQRVDPLRFRANLYVEDLPPWAEYDWLGRQLSAGDARFHVAERIDRCAAINVVPSSGLSDLNLPLALRQTCGTSTAACSCGWNGEAPSGSARRSLPGDRDRAGGAAESAQKLALRRAARFR